MRSLFAVGSVVALALVLAGCDEHATAIPEGAQVVHVVMTDDEVTLQPAVVRSGDVYLVVDEPPDGSLTFVARQDSEAATPGPLGSAELDRLRSGDTFHTSATGIDAGGCSPEQDAAGRGMLGHCGNVLKLTLAAGDYAIVGGSPEADPATGRPAPLAVLTVSP
jgi:hypothetical protein